MSNTSIGKVLTNLFNQEITYNNFNYDQKFLDNFNTATRRVDPFSFNKFINDKAIRGQSLIDILLDLELVVPNIKVPHNINKRMSDELGKKMVLEFFDRLGLKTEAESIIEGSNPMFETHILHKSGHGSCVQHKGTDKKLAFFVDLNGTLEGVSTLAHELAHALCGHYIKFAEILKAQNEIIEKFGEPSKELDDFEHNVFGKFMESQSTYSHDSICEIESHIIEKLFMNFLLEKNTITNEDYEIFLQNLDNSYRCNLSLIFEENTIYSIIRDVKSKTKNNDQKLTMEEFKKVHKKLKTIHHYNDHMLKLKLISERESIGKQNEHSQHRLRYVVAEIVSTVWMERYINSNKIEKQEILKNFKDYLQNSEKYDIFSVLSVLMPGTKIEDIIDEFKQIHQTKNNQITP